MKNSNLYNLDSSYKSKCWDLMEKLFPVYRTLMGEGYRKSLEIINNIIPINVLNFPSGTKCGSWTIPEEWIVNDAYISDMKGKIIIDFKQNSFHIWQYSIPFKSEVTKEELLQHILISEKSRSAIPLYVTYYNKKWGFSMSRNQRAKLIDDKYFVEINTEFKKGNLTIGELYLPGKNSEEIIIDAVLSCSSLANNLSGVVIAAYLGELISKIQDRNYSYRILFTPETIGPIALHYLQDGFGKNVIGGYTLVNLADKKYYHYKNSRKGNTVADLAMQHSLKHFEEKYLVEEYDVLTGTCGNEKAYNSLGIEIPIGAFSRSKLGSYPEYDTSKDDLNFIKPKKIFKSLQVCWGAVQSIERSIKYKHTFKGEPFLTGYGLFPKIESDRDRIPYDYLMGFSDGQMTLVDIAEKANIPVSDFDEPLNLMLEKGLLKKS